MSQALLNEIAAKRGAFGQETGGNASEDDLTVADWMDRTRKGYRDLMEDPADLPAFREKALALAGVCMAAAEWCDRGTSTTHADQDRVAAEVAERAAAAAGGPPD